jgi:Holliday junction resolvase
MTPEAKVKAKIHKALKAAGAYAVNYIGGQFANNGTPDILACLEGRFIGIEAKAGRGKPTDLQISNLRKIHNAGGSGARHQRDKPRPAYDAAAHRVELHRMGIQCH